ncbi:MAG: dihydroorotate dehydrogenase electron transfer subunit [Clostridium sp.]|nr:dihydroorotate dehydrogenase electron transfer subunit [Clostridium sp.]MCM1547833.1 dihydroorotate dehydrogenase electron transfer subunit [Ruminococcus sp.]
MKYTQGKYQILSKFSLAKNIYSMEIGCPEIAEAAQPGQFVHILLPGLTLRRPISICEIDKEKGTLWIVFIVKGKGTEEMSKLNEGDLIDIMAPLGHGFTVNQFHKRVVLIGGGIGTPPMLPLAQIYGKKAIVISGFRNAQSVILQEDFRLAGAKTILCTDDGSAGRKCFVTDPLKEVLNSEKVDAVYACGPTPMLKNVAAIAAGKDVYCEVSLEERMGCGIGACLVCACKTKKNGEEHFAHVCKNGPVFNAKEVVW